MERIERQIVVHGAIMESARGKRPDLYDAILKADLFEVFAWMDDDNDPRWHTKIGELSDQLIAAIEHVALSPEHGHL